MSIARCIARSGIQSDVRSDVVANRVEIVRANTRPNFAPSIRSIRWSSRAVRCSAIAAAATAAVFLLAGCAQVSPAPAMSMSASAGMVASASPTDAAAPAYLTDGSAVDNEPFFDLVNNRLFAANASANGQEIIENLAKSGFRKADMQLTPDRTVGNLEADSVLYSVKIGQFCLLGQYGSETFSSVVEPILTNGACLVGVTRAIDF